MESHGSQSSSVSATTRTKVWTTGELKRASALWKEGKSIFEIAQALNRGRESIKHVTQTRRDLFPRRKQARDYFKDKVNIKIPITEATYKAIQAEAKERGISLNMLIRETLQHRFVRKTWKLPSPIEKKPYSNGFKVD